MTTAALSRAFSDRRLRGYLIGAFTFSWILWIPAGLALREGWDIIIPPILLIILGSFGPMVAAITVAARRGGKSEVKELLGRLRFRGVAKRWFLLAALMGSVTLVPALIYLAAGGHTDPETVTNHFAVLPLHFLIVATIGGGIDEEVGWRGMAQPRMQQHLPPFPANLLLGLIWAVWHLPLWIDPNSAQAAYPFVVYALVIIGHSLVTGWLYNASGGSLLIAVLAHSFNNTFDGVRYAILGPEGSLLGWQLTLAALSLGLGLAVGLATKGMLGARKVVPDADRAAHSVLHDRTWDGPDIPASQTRGGGQAPRNQPSGRSRHETARPG